MLHAIALLCLFQPSPDSLLQEPGGGVTAEQLQRKVDEITPRVAKLRGWSWKKPVPAGVHTPEQFVGFATQEFEEEYGMAKFNAMGEAYRLLGLIDPSINDLYSTFLDLLKDQVGGYYDPKTAKFYMISTFNQGAMADIIMAHELCHALDDQYYDLDSIYEKAKGNTDREFAVRAVVEGSATSLMNLYVMDGMKGGYLDMQSMIEEQQAMMDAQMGSLEASPPYLVITLALPYLEGNKFLVRSTNLAEASMAVPNEADLKRAFTDPPLSSEQVLHSEKYWDPEQRDDPTEVTMPDLSNELGEGWELADTDVLGELAMFVVTEPEVPNFADPMTQLSANWTNSAATGWDGDLYQYYRGPGGAQVLMWASVWDSEADQEQFVGAMEEVAYNRNAFMRSVNANGQWAFVWFSNEAGKAHLKKLQDAAHRAWHAE